MVAQPARMLLQTVLLVVVVYVAMELQVPTLLLNLYCQDQIEYDEGIYGKEKSTRRGKRIYLN